MQATLKVKGLRELHRALKRYDTGLKKELEQELRGAGDIVRDDARPRFSPIDTRSAAGFRTRVKGFGRVVVEQSKKKTTGKHPSYGALQMRRALIPAVAAKENQVLAHVEGMLENLGREEGF